MQSYKLTLTLLVVTFHFGPFYINISGFVVHKLAMFNSCMLSHRGFHQDISGSSAHWCGFVVFCFSLKIVLLGIFLFSFELFSWVSFPSWIASLHVRWPLWCAQSSVVSCFHLCGCEQILLVPATSRSCREGAGTGGKRPSSLEVERIQAAAWVCFILSGGACFRASALRTSMALNLTGGSFTSVTLQSPAGPMTFPGCCMCDGRV